MKRKTCVIDGHRCDISHKCWNEYYPDDKICFGDGFVIHHKNENHFDNSKNNLMKMTRGNHQYLHTKGKKLSKDHIKKMSISRKGKFLGENSSMFGKNHSPETKKKISNTHKGKIVSEETRKKLSTAKKSNNYRLGKKASEETKIKMSLSRKGKNLGNKNNSKKVVAEFIEYQTIKEASKNIGVSTTTIRKRILKNIPGYFYVD